MSSKQFSSDIKLKAVKYYKKINKYVKFLNVVQEV